MDLDQVSLVFLKEKLLPAAIIFVVGVIILNLVMAALKRILSGNKYIDGMLNKFILSAIRVGLWALLLLEVIKKLGVDATSLITVFAAAGAAIALGLQGSLSNLASGILVIFNKPFRRGDYISAAGIEGTVDAIDLLSSTIITADNKIVTMPNSILTSGAITNFTKAGTRRLDIVIGVSYSADIERAKDILIELAKKSGYYLEDNELSCGIAEYANSAVMLRLRGWVDSPAYIAAMAAVNNGIKPAFDDAGIEIPYTQIDIHTR